MDDKFGMTENGVQNLWWFAVSMMAGVSMLLVGTGIANPIVGLGLAFVGVPILWFALCCLFYWPRK